MATIEAICGGCSEKHLGSRNVVFLHLGLAFSNAFILQISNAYTFHKLITRHLELTLGTQIVEAIHLICCYQNFFS